jgi:hypothetical protein
MPALVLESLRVVYKLPAGLAAAVVLAAVWLAGPRPAEPLAAGVPCGQALASFWRACGHQPCLVSGPPPPGLWQAPAPEPRPAREPWSAPAACETGRVPKAPSFLVSMPP